MRKPAAKESADGVPAMLPGKREATVIYGVMKSRQAAGLWTSQGI